LLLQANDLRFGAVPHLFVRHPAAPLLASSHDGSDPASISKPPGLPAVNGQTGKMASDNSSESAAGCVALEL
jgi:hypothetical protein